jgi:hypothetical protein
MVLRGHIHHGRDSELGFDPRPSSMRDNFGGAVDSTARQIRLAGDINMTVSDLLAADRPRNLP